jgi:HprK-related kinase A
MRLGTSLPELVEPVSMLYGGFTLGPEDEIPDFIARVDPLPRVRALFRSQAATIVDGRRVFDPFPRRQALPMLEWVLNWCLFTRPNQYLLLHSAVVDWGGQSLLLSGQPGAGKSTLTAGLLMHGWRLLSDELAVVDPATRRLHALPRPVGLKEASIAIVRALWPEAAIGPATADTRKGTVAHLRPPRESVRRAQETSVARWVVFPRFVANAEVRLQQVSRADALLRLGREAFNYSMLGEEAFHTLAAMLDGCECIEVEFGQLTEAIDAITELTSGGRDSLAAPGRSAAALVGGRP